MIRGNIMCSKCRNDTFFVVYGFYDYYFKCVKCGSTETKEAWRHHFNFYNDYGGKGFSF